MPRQFRVVPDQAPSGIGLLYCLAELLPFGIQCDHLPNIVINEIRLIKFRSDTEHPRAIFGAPEFVIAESRRKFRFSILATYYEEDFSKLSPTLSVYDTVYTRDKRFLPHFKSDVPRSKWPLSVKTMLFYPLDGICRLLLVEIEPFLLQTVDDVLVDLLDPLAYHISPVLNALIICPNVVISAHCSPFFNH